MDNCVILIHMKQQLTLEEAVREISLLVRDNLANLSQEERTEYVEEISQIIRGNAAGRLKTLVRDKQGNQSVSSFAASISCSKSHIYEIYNGTRRPGRQILTKLGIEKETIYKKRWR